MTKCTEENKPIMVGDRTIPPPDARFITISIMGQPYEVPETLTILKAMELPAISSHVVAAAVAASVAPAAPSTASRGTTPCAPGWPARLWSKPA